MQEKLTLEEQKTLLRLAREAMERAVRDEELLPLDLTSLPLALCGEGSSFVTLTSGGLLRGCIGALEACQPLAEDVRVHAIAAARKDPRFPSVHEEELSTIQIEVSRLTRPTPLVYKDAEDLLSKLRPQVDGVILCDNSRRRVTFLPQVWAKIPDPAQFLNNLCYKMGLEPDAWCRMHFEVLTYQAEEFHE
ncbi:MAG TPA: AmmeMemoRadiSam system protein A [Anaerolineales bacterium]|jgi:AmmeMemoRadiSam system protein A|nr:AmmeMemoRadiSam system protein A [Anaerolineales bacterium]